MIRRTTLLFVFLTGAGLNAQVPTCWELVAGYVDVDVAFISALHANSEDRTSATVFTDMLEDRVAALSGDAAKRLSAQVAVMRFVQNRDEEDSAPSRRGLLMRAARALGDGLGLRRKRDWNALLHEAGWGPEPLPEGRPIVSAELVLGIPLRVRLTFAKNDQSPLFALHGMSEADNQIIFDRFPYATSIRHGADGEMNFIHTKAGYLRSVLRGYPGPLAHFRAWMDRALTPPLENVSAQVGNVLHQLPALLNEYAAEIRPAAFQAAREYVRRVGKVPEEHQSIHDLTLYRLARLLDGKALPADFQFVVYSPNVYPDVMDRAVASLVHHLLGRHPMLVREALQTILHPTLYSQVNDGVRGRVRLNHANERLFELTLEYYRRNGADSDLIFWVDRARKIARGELSGW